MENPDISLTQAAEEFKDCFSDLPDPRSDRLTPHPLENILVISFVAVLCGADYWTDVESFGNAKKDFFSSFLNLKNGVPSHDTFGKVFAQIDPDAFGKCFMEWVGRVFEVPAGATLNIDGKTVRGSRDESRGGRGVHLVNVWVNEASISLGQLAVSQKSNEITAIPKLLDLIDIEGCVVTIDSMGCQKKIAQKIRGKGGHYLLALKGNQTELNEKVQHLFTIVPAKDTFYQIEKDHGRIEHRTVSVIDNLTWLDVQDEWEGLQTIVKIDSKREIGDIIQTESRYYISSQVADAKEIGIRTRKHWGVENNLHWCLDVGFSEDKSRVRKDHAPVNLALLRKFALNTIKQDNSIKGGIAAKRKRAGWDQRYLLRLLAIAFP